MQLTKCSKDILKLLQIMELCEDRELIALVLKKIGGPKCKNMINY